MKKWRCTVCGQIFEGDAPPNPCPVCGVGAAAFEEVREEEAPRMKASDDRVVIIGGGLAALSAAKALRKRNPAALITLASAEAHCPYNRPALPRVVADGLPFDALLLEPESYYPDHQIQLLTGAQASSIDAAAQMVHLADGRKLPYTKLLLATGAHPFNPIKTGPGCVPVKVLRSYEDALELAALCTHGKRVVLVGGGILGLEAAAALHKCGAVITVVEFAPRILPLQTDETVSRMLAAHLEAMGITLRFSASAQQATARGLLLNNGIELETDLVLASMGVRSATELAAPIGLELNRGIVVDSFMRTSLPNIWAAGDCAEYDGRVMAVAGAAAGMGEAAGASMAGDEECPYRSFVPAAAFELSGFSMFAVGTVEGDAEETLLYQHSGNGLYKRLFFNDGALTGVLFVGENPGAAAGRALLAKATPKQAQNLLY
jgi:NAD(P)H-nitrite reductase large subunit/rubredoxin